MRKVNVILIPMLMIVLFLVLGARQSRSEYIFMKDGPIIQGTVIGDTKANVTVRTKDNKITTIPRNKVSRVLYTDMYLGKLTVRLTNGNTFLGYMVDEDANTYTFRKILDNPEEFMVKRKEVLFTARRNPSDLKGKAGDDSADLTWNAPYNSVSDYKIYQKGADDKEFKHVETSGDRKETIGNLKSSAKYQFYVTAVDSDDEESFPSDIISLTTRNRPPLRPGNLKVEKNEYMNKTKMNAKLSWDKATDPDGTVAHYNVYLKSDLGTKLQGKATQTSYTIYNLNKQEEYGFIVRSVDNAGAESEDVVINQEGTAVQVRPQRIETPSGPGNISLTAYAAYLQPFGEFDNIADPGFSVFVNCTYHGLLLQNLRFGLETGFFFFTGDSGIEQIKGHILVPLYAVFGYDVRITGDWYLLPEAGMGYSCNIVLFREYDASEGEIVLQHDYAFEPIFMGGLSVSYRGFQGISIFLGARYYGIIEKDAPDHLIHFCMVHAGAGFRL